MSIDEEKSWENEAKHNLGICCETLCDKQVVERYVDYLEKKVNYLEDKIRGYERSIEADNSKEPL